MLRDAICYARDDDALLISLDAGRSWRPTGTRIRRDLPVYYLYHTSLLAYGSQTDSLWYSHDSGTTWQPLVDDAIPSGLKVLDLFTLPDDRIYMVLKNPANKGGATIFRTVKGPVSEVEGGPGELPDVLLLR